MATSSSTPTTPTAPKTTAPTEPESAPTTTAIVDDAAFDWGTRFRADRNTPPTMHLGGMPTVIPAGPTPRLDKPLPELDPAKAVVPTANVPLEILVQRLVDKALDDKDKEVTAADVIPQPQTLTAEEADAAAKADAEATKAAAEQQTNSSSSSSTTGSSS